jgi:hypothetical protein
MRNLHFHHPWRSAEIVLLQFLHFHHPWRSAEIVLLQFLHFHHPWRSDVPPFQGRKSLKCKRGKYLACCRTP